MKNLLFIVLCFILFTASFAESSESTLEAKPLFFSRWLRNFRRRRRRSPPKLSNFCSAWGDPHYTQSFTNKRFDNYRVGDYVIAQTHKFTVHARQRPWHRAAVAVRMVVKPNLGRTKFEVQSASKQILNGRPMNMRVGQIIRFRAGGYVHRHTFANFKVVGVGGDYIDMRVNTGRGWPQSHYIDFTMYVKNPYGAKGLCMGPSNIVPAHGLFHRFVKPMKLKPFHIKKIKLMKAERICKKNKVPKKFWKQCATDLLLSNFRISPAFFRKFFKLEKKDIKKFKKMVAKKKLIVHKRKVHHFCRAQGDPHFLSFFNKRFDNYQIGDFILAETKNFAVHSRQRAWHRAAVNTRIVVRANKKTIFELQSTSKQILNGKPLRLKIGQKIKFKRGGYVIRKSQNTFKVEGMTGDYIDMVVNEGKNWPQKHYIDFVMKLDNPRKSKGLCNSPKQVIPAHGLFHRFVAPKKLKPLKYSKRQFKRAMRMCKKAGVNKRNRKQCAIDIILSNFRISPKRTLKILKLAKKDKKKFRKTHPKLRRIIKKIRKIRKIRRIRRRIQKRRARKLMKKLKRSKRFRKLPKRKQRKLIRKIKRMRKIRRIRRKRAIRKIRRRIQKRRARRLMKKLKRSKRFRKLPKRKQRKLIRRIKRMKKIRRNRKVRRIRRRIQKRRARKLMRKLKRSKRFSKLPKRKQRKLIKKIWKMRKIRKIKRRGGFFKNLKRFVNKVRKHKRKAFRKVKKFLKRKVRKIVKRKLRKLFKRLQRSKRFKKLSKRKQRKLIRRFKKAQKKRALRKLKKSRKIRRAIRKAKVSRRIRRFVKKAKRTKRKVVRRIKKSRKGRRAQRKAKRAMRRAKRLQRKLQRKARRIARRQKRQQRRLQRKVRRAQKKLKRRPLRKILKRRRVPSKIKRVIKFIEKRGVSLRHMIKNKMFKKLSRRNQKMIIRKVQRDRRRLGRYVKVKKYIKSVRSQYQAKLRKTIAALRKECAKKLRNAISNRRKMKVILRRKIKKDLLSSDKFAGRLSNIVKREVIRQVGRKGCCKGSKRRSRRSRRSRRDDDDDEDCDE